MWQVLFRRPPSEPRGHRFRCTWLSSDYSVSARWLPVVDGLVAGGADHEGLALRSGHELRPRGLWPSRPGEVGELADLVDLHLGRVCSQSSHRPARSRVISSLRRVAGTGGRSVEDRFLLPSERDTTEPGDQWFPARPFDGGLEAGARPVRGVDRGLVLAGHLRHRRVVLGGQRLEHRGLDDPSQPVQSPDVTGEQVVLDDAPVLGPVGADDRVVVEVQQLGAARGFAVLEVRGALGLDHRPGHAQPDRSR